MRIWSAKKMSDNERKFFSRLDPSPVRSFVRSFLTPGDEKDQLAQLPQKSSNAFKREPYLLQVIGDDVGGRPDVKTRGCLLFWKLLGLLMEQDLRFK